jgi:uncharacterized phage-associated protein
MAEKVLKKPYNAEQVARYFIYLATQKIVGDNDEREGITNLKLQKILYLAQAYYLSKFNKPLFKDEIEAWAYGPVVPTVYHTYKKNKSNPIFRFENGEGISDEDKKILEEVWNAFGGYSAGRLVEVTHAHTPWQEAYKSEQKTISHEALTKYYAPLLKK